LPNEGDGGLIIYDMVGRAVQQTNLSSSVNAVSFNLVSNLAKGTYQVVLKQQGKILKVRKLNVLQ
jgi:hypothetical protein